ncbi:Yif1 family [Sesbania bispinosa]|nr:Yif1 family [Sesbania bispinosa]
MGAGGVTALHVAAAAAERSTTVGESGRTVVAGGMRLRTSGKGGDRRWAGGRRRAPRRRDGGGRLAIQDSFDRGLSAYGEKNKLKVILFPFLHRGHWTRITEPVGGRLSYKPPIYDINAPDLYIPLMAFGTYVVLAGISFGLRGK